MNFTVPLIALCMATCKIITKKYNTFILTPYILIAVAFAASIFFYMGFCHLIPFEGFFLVLYLLPFFNCLLAKGFELAGWQNYTIPACMLINFLASSPFIAHGILPFIQIGWSLSLISSIVITINSDYIKPLKEARSKKHEYSV